MWLIVTLLLMFYLSVLDIKFCTIPLWGILAMYVIAISYAVISPGNDWTDIAISCVPGCFFVLIAYITKEKMGTGDGLILIAIGIAFGLERCLYILTVALFLNCVIAGGLLAIKKVKKETKIPFVPFLTLGIGVINVFL